MQNNVTELTQRLLQSLDANYNVIDMPAVTEILSLLEKVAITKELLETTRLGKHVNELRRKTTNESLSKRAKELVKKWRNIFIPESNGQIKQPPSAYQEDVNLNQLIKSKKRPAKDNATSESANAKRPKTNGQMSELDFSDNSNSSFKDVINYSTVIKNDVKRDISLINSDSNSSVPDIKNEPQLEQHLPKKRGRKKGSTNHRKLVDEAESSFTNKLAVSRGNSKVKTTQELIASLQNKNTTSSLNISPTTNVKKEDLNERAAKLTQLVSIIDQKLNTNSNRFKNSQRNKNKYGQSASADKNDRVIESGSVINDKSIVNITNRINSSAEDEIVIVDEPEPLDKSGESFVPEEEKPETDTINKADEIVTKTKSLSVEEILEQLPPIDRSVLSDENGEVKCSCYLKETKPEDFSVGDDFEGESNANAIEFVEDEECPAKSYLEEKYHIGDVTDSRVKDLHTRNIPNINGNFSIGPSKDGPLMTEDGLYVNVVPNVNNETLPKDFSGENYKRYSISETVCGEDSEDFVKVKSEDDRTDMSSFREWHEVVDTPSYNGEILKILPYVIID